MKRRKRETDNASSFNINKSFQQVVVAGNCRSIYVFVCCILRRRNYCGSLYNATSCAVNCNVFFFFFGRGWFHQTRDYKIFFLSLSIYFLPICITIFTSLFLTRSDSANAPHKTAHPQTNYLIFRHEGRNRYFNIISGREISWGRDAFLLEKDAANDHTTFAFFFSTYY